MRGQDKYDAMVRKERAALDALAQLRHRITKRAIRRLARRPAVGEVANQTLVATAATMAVAASHITAVAAIATDFCEEEPRIAPNEKDLRVLMEALIDGGCFAMCFAQDSVYSAVKQRETTL